MTTPSPPPRRVPRWLAPAFAALFLLAGTAVAGWSVTLPYFAFSPGPVADSVREVHVDANLPSYKPKGELLMLTVSLQEVNPYEALAAELDPAVDLVPADEVRPKGTTQQDFTQQNLQMMDTSKETAIALALHHLGISSGISSDGVQVVQLLDGAPAAQVLKVGDVITAVEGTKVQLADDIAKLLQGKKPGDDVTLTISRDGQQMDVTVRLFAQDSDPNHPLIGILAQTLNPRFPVDINSSDIGGPSAGLMYTLAVIDVLTPDDITKGHVVAGTGTINPDGTVGPIGGIRQKLVAAAAAGAEYALVPKDNFTEAQTAPVKGIQLVPVSTLDDALTFLSKLPPA